MLVKGDVTRLKAVGCRENHSRSYKNPRHLSWFRTKKPGGVPRAFVWLDGRHALTAGCYDAFAMGSGSISGRVLRKDCHRSHFIWFASHDSGVVPVSIPTLMAISAVMEACPFKRRERCGREIPRRAATSPMLNSGGRNSRNTSPGCAGLCMRVIFLLLMIVLVVD